jgi:hypothetical protein
VKVIFEKTQLSRRCQKDGESAEPYIMHGFPNMSYVARPEFAIETPRAGWRHAEANRSLHQTEAVSEQEGVAGDKLE